MGSLSAAFDVCVFKGEDPFPIIAVSSLWNDAKNSTRRTEVIRVHNTNTGFKKGKKKIILIGSNVGCFEIYKWNHSN